MIQRVRFWTYFLIAAGIGLGSSALAEDKSATRDGLVKLPSSGGTVQKDESSFDFSTSRGAVSYSIPLPQLPSRGGMKPSLAFVYNQSAGDSGSGLGIGWSVASSSISFNDDLGTAIKQKRSDNGDFSSHLALDGQRLISHLSNTIGGDLEYSLETSGAFVKVRYTKNPLRVNYLGKNGERLIYSFPAGFIVTSPSGQKAYFAENRDFVESDPLNPSFIVRWPMTAEINPQGEAIFYTYTKQGERSYLSKVSFAAGQSEYNFELIATRPSLVSNKASFRQLSKVLFGGVSASFRGEVQSQICLAFVGRSIDSDLFTVRAGEHCLDKAKGDLAASLDKTKTRSLNVLDQLRTIYRFGKGSSFDAANALPKLSFEYSNWNENDTITNIVYPAAALSQTNSSTSFELFDYNLDSVADLIQSTSQSLKISLGTDNLETSFTNSVSWTVERDGVKITPKIDSPSWHFVDLNGDSLMDLVEVGEGKIHVYLRKLDGKFEPATTLDFDWINPGLFESRKFRWLDINNDGLTDLIGTEIQGNNLVWKIAINQTLRTAQGFDYYFLETTQQLPFDAPLGNLLADESVLLADVNGDQLSDLVRIRPDRGGICIYENQGDIYAAPEKQLFSFADADVLSASNCEKGRFVAIDGLAHDLQTASRRVWFLDANGDGILDLVSFNSDDTQMRVWLGFGNGDFLKDPLKFSTLDAEGRPQINVQSGRERTRVADIDGDGQTELVIFQPGIVGLKPAVVIDFNRQGKNQLIKSNLLTTIENATGLRYDLRYSSSTDEMLRDHSEGLTSAPLHFPIYVVKQMVISELDPFHPGEYKDGREVKEMLYHQPIYDFTSRKLVGFRSVETITYGDEFLAQDERSQLSSYRREIFESDFRLAGKTKELYVHEFTPAEKFAEQSQDTHNLALREVTLHSMKEYSQTQGTPLAGRILFSKKFQRHLVPAAQGYDEESAYFSRDLSEESATYGSTGSASKSSKIFSQFDGFNMPTVIEEMRDAITGPNGLLIPARNTRHVLDFSESRRQLADLDIITLPSEQKTYVIENLQQEMVASTHIEYGPTGLAKKSTEEAFYDRFAVSAELQAPASRISERSFDIFGNPTTFSMNGVLLETVRFDPTGTMPIEQVNAVGHQTRMYYGSDPIEGCSSIPELAVHEGVLKAYRDPRGVCHYFSFDSFGRRTLYQRDDGYQEQYRYRFAEAGTDSRIFKQARRYAEGAVLPANESTWIQSLELYTPNGVKVASLENLELDQGVRIVSYEEHNRKKNTIRVYTPFRDTTTTLQDVFQSGLIPVTKKEGFTQTVYDALDRPVQRIYPTERTEHYTYEPWGQTQVSLYDKGQGLGTVDVIKKTVQFGKQIFAIVDERNAITRFAYDTYDNVSEVWLPGQTEARRYTYDSLDRKLQQCFPGMGCSTFQYDQVDQLSVRTNYDGTMKKISTLTFFYDVLGRLQELNDNGRLLTRNQYDRYPVELQSLAQSSAVGFLTRSQSFDGNKLYDQAKIQVYDRAGQVVLRRIDMSGAQTRSFIEKFVYTLDGALQESVDPQGVRSFYRLSPTMRFTHLELELPWQRGTRETIVDNVKYSPKGQVEQIAYRKGSYTNLAYDSKTLLLTQIESSYQKADGQREFLQYASLAFDGNGSITEITDTIPAQTSYGAIDRSAKFTYNDRDELVEFKRYGETQSFDYDGAGNFTRNTELGSQLAPVTGNTLLPRSSVDHRYTFDAQGQLKSRKFMGTVASQDPLQDLQKRRQILDTRFNSLGQLVYLKTDTQEIYYGYDSDGQRSYKRIAATGTHVAADSLFPTKTFTVEPTGGQSFVLIGDRRIARIEHAQDTFSKGQWFYYLLDHLGSTDFTMNSDGTPVEQMIYRAYGTEPDINLLTQGIVWKNHQNTHQSMMPKERTHHRYTGQYLDDDSGLYYYGSRYYDPQLGRFISPDDAFLENPESCIERPLECNAYGYAANNPVKYSDPTGKWAHIVIGAVVGGVIGGAADAIFNPNSNWKTVAAAAAGGTVTGALAAATGGASLAAQSTVSAVAIGAGVGAASAGAGNVVQQGINLASNQQKSFSGTQLGTSMAIGGLAGGAGAAVSRGLSSAASRALRATPCGCFAPGTLVMTPDGLKPIESLQAGDLVMAQDVATGKLAAKAIAQTFHYELRPYYELTFADDQGQIETITVTDDHPIFIKDAGWVRSKDLKAGQELVQSNGKNARIISFAFTGRFGKTFNFEVQDFHTYFVANHGILVHNNTPCNTAVGYAAGVAKSAFTPDRLQHASRHLIDDGILPNWSKATAQKFTEMGTKILEAPIKTFDHVLRGNNPVKAFYGVVDGKDIVVMVYKSGVDQGKVATAVQATSQQVQNWGLH